MVLEAGKLFTWYLISLTIKSLFIFIKITLFNPSGALIISGLFYLSFFFLWQSIAWHGEDWKGTYSQLNLVSDCLTKLKHEQIWQIYNVVLYCLLPAKIKTTLNGLPFEVTRGKQVVYKQQSTAVKVAVDFIGPSPPPSLSVPLSVHSFRLSYQETTPFWTCFSSSHIAGEIYSFWGLFNGWMLAETEIRWAGFALWQENLTISRQKIWDSTLSVRVELRELCSSFIAGLCNQNTGAHAESCIWRPHRL